MSKKLMPLISVLLIAVFVLAACGTPTAEPTAVPAEPTAVPTEVPAVPTDTPVPEPTAVPVQLRIWADENRAPILQELAPSFLETYGVELVVELKSAIRDDFQVAAPTGEGPDIIIIPHDQAGTLVANGLLAPVDLGEKADQFVEVAKGACTIGGILYCMPYATENMGFFYNTDLVATPPATWDEVVTMGEALKAEGKVDYIMALTGTTYDIYPLDTAFGGYIFGKDANGDWNPQDLGVDSAGMIAAGTWLQDNIDKGNLPTDTNNDANRVLFEQGKVPFLMGGPWHLAAIRASGVKYAVTNFPAGPAGPGNPFAGTQGFFISAQSKNVLLAQAFLTEFVASEEVMAKLVSAGDPRPSAFIPVLDKTEDVDLKAMAIAGANATMMPNIPEMGSVWGNWGDAFTLIITGKQEPEPALMDAAKKIRGLISGAAVGMVNVPGSYQAQAGCPGDWQPDCEVTAMTKGDDGLYKSGPFKLTAGDYEFKVAMDGGWDVNYGMDGKAGGDNYKVSMTADGEISFIFDPATFLLTWEIK